MKAKKNVFNTFILGLALASLPISIHAADLLNQINSTTDWSTNIDRELTRANKEKDLVTRIERYCGVLLQVVNATSQPHEIRDHYFSHTKQKIETFIDREQRRLGTLTEHSMKEDGIEPVCEEEILGRLYKSREMVNRLTAQYETQQSLIKTIWSYPVTKICAGVLGFFCLRHLYNTVRGNTGAQDQKNNNSDDTILTEREQRLVDNYEKQLERDFSRIEQRIARLDTEEEELTQKIKCGEESENILAHNKKCEQLGKERDRAIDDGGEAWKKFLTNCKGALSSRKFNAVTGKYLTASPEIKKYWEKIIAAHKAKNDSQQ